MVTTMDLLAILTDATCGQACWYAKEDVCRCRCGGENHGCLLMEGAEQPTRTKKKQHKLYELVSVVIGYWDSQQTMDALDGNRNHSPDWDKVGQHHASSAQKSNFRWPELAGFTPSTGLQKHPYLIWKRIR